MSEVFTTTVSEEVTDPVRLDVYLSRLDLAPNRSALKQRIESVRKNGTEAKLSARVAAGDHLEVVLNPPPPMEIEGEDIPLDIIYEDERAVVINKPPGMVVHPGAGNWTGTLLHALVGRYPESLFFSEREDGSGDAPTADEDRSVRPGIVHRLDKDTGGVIIVAKDRQSHSFLTAQFSKRRTRKVYIALVKGSPVHSCGFVDGDIGRDRFHRMRFSVIGELHHHALAHLDQAVEGWDDAASSDRAKAALTTYRVLRRFPSGYSLLLVRPHTGRTHQIRVHLSSIGHPIVGDPMYARQDARFASIGLMLHAWRLEIALGRGEERLRFSAPVSREFRRGMAILRDKKD